MVEEMREEINEEMVEESYIEQELGLQKETKRRNLVPLWIFIGLVIIGSVFAGYQWFWNKTPVIPVEKPAVVTSPKPIAEDEAEEPVALTEGQEKFGEIFTETLLKDALANAGKGFDLAMLRNMIRIAMNAEFLGDKPGMTWEKWEKERAGIQKMTRKELSDPGFLKRLWKRYGIIVVTAVKVSGKSTAVKMLCLRATPYFSGELSHSRFVQLDDYYKTDTRLEREIQKRKYSKDAIRELTQKLDKKYRVLKTSGLDDTDIYFFEFSMRRIQEGGRELAKAYGEILIDISNSL
ncbi:MAG: hypothetical protein KAH24_09690 [Holophagae bacterium]|nr:hypothetical protein [Holophagae bacterium]